MSEQQLTEREALAVYERHGAHNTTEIAAVILRLERERDRAMEAMQDARENAKESDERAALAQLALAGAWKLIGRCDMAFELIATAVALGTARKAARKLRTEIAQAPEGAGK